MTNNNMASGCDTEQQALGLSPYVNFKELLETLNKKIWNPDLHFSEFEVAEVIRHLDQVEKVIYLTWRV
jgi:hypothetical protein